MRRLSTKKVTVSKPTFKHTNDKVIITLFVYNREYNYYLNKLNSYITLGYNKIFNLSNFVKLNNKKALFKNLNKKILIYNKKFKIITNKLKYLHYTLKKNFDNIKDLFKCSHIVNFFNNNLYKNYIIKIMEKEILNMYLKQLIFFNNYKFKDTYILPLKNLIEVIYGKRIEFNIIILKNYYFNSDIYTQIIALKTKNRKNKILKILKISLKNIKIPNINKELLIDHTNGLKKKQNIYINEIKANDINNDYADIVIKNSYKLLEKKIFFDSIKNKNIIGIRIETSGRLTKRMTAARSLFKVKYKGTLKNIDSSYKGISSLMLRGNQKSNLQYTKLNSKLRVGSFGIKG